MLNSALENTMKIKDVLGEAEVTLKPMPGAQEIDMDGKPIGTATTPDAANAIADLAKKGEFTAIDPNKPTSEDQLDGGDVPDTNLTDTDGPGYSFDSAKGFKDAISKELGSKDPELNAQIDKLVVAEPDGTVDVDQTFYNMIEVVNNELLPAMLKFVKDMITAFTDLTRSPEWAQVSPADQASVLQSIKDMQASLPKIEQEIANAHAEFEKNKPMLQQNIKDRKMNQQLKGAPTDVQEELARWKKIAGLKEAESPFPSRNLGTPAATQATATQPTQHQSVMPSRNKPQYTADEMTAILSGQKTQQQVDAEKAAKQEGHKDTIAQGGGDVGGDATDSFIDQVRDKGYERKNRGASGIGNKSTLSEKDELYKWLTIAGVK